MSDEVLRNDTQELERVEQEVNIEELVKELKKEGLDHDQILEALEEMLKEGKITEEDVEKAKELLENEEKEDASSLFGVNII